jgi:hypothetical protein
MKFLPRSALGSGAATVSLAITAVALLVGPGCAPARQGPPSAITPLKVIESDFHISAPKRASAGTRLLQVKNQGPDSHELIVVRTSGSLPIRSDGMTVDEEALQSSIAGLLEPGEVGSDRRLQLHLTPGRYELFCNMAGHYMAGMHSEMVVR